MSGPNGNNNFDWSGYWQWQQQNQQDMQRKLAQADAVRNQPAFGARPTYGADPYTNYFPNAPTTPGVLSPRDQAWLPVFPMPQTGKYNPAAYHDMIQGMYDGTGGAPQMPVLPSIGSPVAPNVAGHIAYNQANPLNVQSVLPTTTQKDDSAFPSTTGGGLSIVPFQGAPNGPGTTNTNNPPKQKDDAVTAPKTTTNTGGGAGAKSNNPNVPPNAIDSGRGDKIWTDGRGKHSDNDYIEASYRFIDDKFRDGFTDAFIQQHGTDPLSFYKRAFLNDKDAMGWDTGNEKAAQYVTFRAAEAAINDARFLPGAVDEWISKHGMPTAANPIPQEQWETWWRISQSTNGYGINGGAGVSQYGVY